MLKLFKVQGKATTVYFYSKAGAKEYRDGWNEESLTVVFVSRGPDHWRGESFNHG